MGLRETKKQAMREQIADAAMRLFVTRGFDHVTVAEIAQAVGVSEKTVFNYYPTKEDLFFDEAPERLRQLADALRDRPDGETIVGAVRRLQLSQVDRLTQPGFAPFARVIEESPALQMKEVDLMARFAQILAAELQDQGVRERDARVAAGLIMSVHRQFFRAARLLALDGNHGPAAARRLKADMARAYEILEHGVGATIG
ncbi:MAG TPA: TetR/AcrR family transcriptional regulator [Gaiellaceae bacterium]|nr:TetR/AcrR family transcriptional regulator [Gaiellaceae bacterium]